MKVMQALLIKYSTISKGWSVLLRVRSAHAKCTKFVLEKKCETVHAVMMDRFSRSLVSAGGDRVVETGYTEEEPF